MYQKIIGFAPDVDPATPGVLTDCDAMIPTIKGMKAMPSDVDTTFADLSAACQGAVQITKVNGSSRLFLGTQSKLYEGTPYSWTDVSGTSDYAIGVDGRWRFAQFGNVTLAAGDAPTLQYSNGSGAFADVSGAPRVKIIETVGDFVMALDTNDTTYGDQQDRWWCAALGTYDSWTPSIASQCATGRLLDTPGPIVGGRRLGQYMTAYKTESMYLGVFIGPPLVWSWQLVPSDVGALNHECIVPVDSFHYFIGLDDFYYFDGTSPQSIGVNAVREWFFDTLDINYRHLVVGVHDGGSFLIYWFFPSTSNQGVLDKYIAYNYRSKRWGYGNKTIQFALSYKQPATTYDALGNLYATYDDIPATLTYDSLLWQDVTPLLATIDSSNHLYTASGTATASFYVTNDLGTEEQISLLSRVRPRFNTSPASGTQTHYYRDNLGDAKTTGDQCTLEMGRYDLIHAARWHSVKHSFVGDVEIVGIDYEIEADSLE